MARAAQHTERRDAHAGIGIVEHPRHGFEGARVVHLREGFRHGAALGAGLIIKYGEQRFQSQRSEGGGPGETSGGDMKGNLFLVRVRLPAQ